jgi:endo-1,4-beta-xylanase
MCSTSVTVADSLPPDFDLVVSPNVLWPPNHRLVTIQATFTVNDDCDPAPSVRLISITSNESDNGEGDGNTTNDIQGAAFGTEDRAFQLRAERTGKGIGRIYTITYQMVDASGNSAERQATVTVPKSQGRGQRGRRR